MTLNTTTILAAVSAWLPIATNGQAIDPINIEWKQSNAFNNLRLASNLENATGMAANSNLVATFSKQIQAGASGNVTIRKTSDNTVVEAFAVASSSQLTFSSAQLTINPTANLLPGTEYYVQIDAGAIKDASGERYGSSLDGVRAFRTGNAAEARFTG